MMKVVNFTNEPSYVKQFINLPKRLYAKEENMENPEETTKLLLGVHPLNKYFKLYKFIVLDNKKCVGRFCLTVYPNDYNAYIGFYECTHDDNAAELIFNEAYKFSKELGLKNIVGPVDASFWHKYRLKINLFDKMPYTGEPYNKSYYLKQFINNNFEITEHYTSNIYDVVSESYSNAKFENHFERFIKSGYEIISPNINNYDNLMKELYCLLTELYSDFPIFKNIESEDFCSIFQSYKSIMNMDMIKAAFYKNKLVGFFISVPNYNNLVYHLNLVNIIKILKIKKHPKEYVLLYMGVDRNHRGLGKALASSIADELKRSKLPSIGALARDGKPTQNYAEDLIEKRYEYVLLERKI